MASETGCNNGIVEDWLRSLNMVQYTQAFLDNGYDDLEVCKQIGEDDLEAIGVPKDATRDRLLLAVKKLQEEGGTAVYFTLEDCDTGQADGQRSEVKGESNFSSGKQFSGVESPRMDTGGSGVVIRQDGSGVMRKKTAMSYSKVQLGMILREKLLRENIDLAEPPFTNSDLAVCGSSLTALGLKFAEELQTDFMEVLEGLEELWMVARCGESCQDMCRSVPRGVYGGSQGYYWGYPSHYMPHPHPHYYINSIPPPPPPLPACPPPSSISGGGVYLDRCSSLQTHLDTAHTRTDSLLNQNYASFEGETTGVSDDKKKTGSVFGRFLRNIGFRRSSNRKGSYNKYQGDLSAYEISMGDEDRMALMFLVKEGKISTQTALAVDSSSKKAVSKKKKSVKTFKSQQSSDESKRFPQVISPSDGEPLSCDHFLCRQRRVHSLGQLDSPSNLPPPLDPELANTSADRAGLSRAMSTSPASNHSSKVSSLGEPPVLTKSFNSSQHQLQQHSNHHHHHHGLNKVDALRERLTGRPCTAVPKTSSKTSLLSSGSDQSMDCGMQISLHMDTISGPTTDAAAYNSNSTVSATSDNNNSPVSGRKKNGIKDHKLKQNHRSASCSTGDDGISSGNEDTDSNSRRNLHPETARDKSSGEISGSRSPRLRSRPHIMKQQSAAGVSSPARSFQFLGQARVINDYTPAVHEIDFHILRKGDIINVISMAPSGVWLGVCRGRRGKFKFENVEVLTRSDRVSTCDPNTRSEKDAPKSVTDLLHQIGLSHLVPLFVLSGYDDLEILAELDERDLDLLHITDSEHKGKILSAARALTKWSGNSSCDSGCYMSGDGKLQNVAQGSQSERDDTKMETPTGISQHPNPCHYCGKPKPLSKYIDPYSSRLHSGSIYYSGQYSARSQYAPGHYSRGSSHYSSNQYSYVGSQQYGSYGLGNYGFNYPPGYNHYGSSHAHQDFTLARTMSELSVKDNQTISEMAVPNSQQSSMRHLEPLVARKYLSNTHNPVYTDRILSTSTRPLTGSDKGPNGERISLTEEDKEVIAITYGTNNPRKLSAPVQSFPGRTSQLGMMSANSMTCSVCIPSSGCAQCDENLLCDSLSCQQCATYMSCSQCFPPRQYLNNTIRSDSKSSKMSCSSTCTQTTCLSPDHDENNYSGGSNLLDYATGSSQGSYYAYRTSQGKPQHSYYHPQHNLQYSVTSNLPQAAKAQAQPHIQLSPPSSTQLESSMNLSMPLPSTATNSSKTPSVKSQNEAAPPPVAAPVNWSSHLNDTEAPGMATLYSRGKMQTLDKTDKGGDSQMKSPTRSLMPLVTTKLSAEMIDLTQLPYSTTMGHCGIPPLLVQRYSEELRQDLETISTVLEQLREKQLRSLGRPCIQNESLSESCKNACDLQISSIQNFLISISLPMYQKSLMEGGINSLDKLLLLKESEIEQMTGADSRHLRRIAHALEWVQHKLVSPSHVAGTNSADKE